MKRDKKKVKTNRAKSKIQTPASVVATSTITLMDLFMDIIRPTVIVPEHEQNGPSAPNTGTRDIAECAH
jgi:hypothetical protein